MSKVIHFSILGQTLCGARDEPIDESRADTAEFCDDCVQVMWKEQYRRKTVLKVKVKVNEEDITHEYDDSEEQEERLFLIDFKQS